MKAIRLSFLMGLALASPVLADDKAGPSDNKAPEGYTLLFNGKDLTNWQGAVAINQRSKPQPELAKMQEAANKLAMETWAVKDGILAHTPKVDAKGKKSGVSLGTVKDYGDFEMLIDWKIEEQGDSGIYVRGQPQIQIWDSDKSGGARGDDKGSGSGGLWNNPLGKGEDPKKIGKMPLKKADKKPGEWNTFKIVMKGENVTIHLNGELVVDNAKLANYWEKGKPLPTTGPIELQYHGDKLWFKNIYIKELSK